MSRRDFEQILRYVEAGLLDPAEARDIASQAEASMTPDQLAELRQYE